MSDQEIINKYRSDQPKLTSTEKKQGFVMKGLRMMQGELAFHFYSPRQARHPSEYNEESNLEQEMGDIDERIYKFLSPIEEKHSITIEVSAD